MQKPKRLRLPAEQRRAQIVDVATRLIGERGYWGVSLQDIAGECGISDTAVLHYFGTKEGLLLSVLERRDECDREALAELLGVPVDELYDRLPEIPLLDFCAALVARNSTQPEIVALYAILDAEALQPDHPAHDYFEARERRVLASFAAVRSDLDLPPEQRARFVLSLMDGLQLRWLRNRDGFDPVEEWASIARTVLAPR